MDLALGLIETRGLVGAIEAADAMVKAANVKIIGKEKVSGALIIIKIMGETAAVKASIDAGAFAAQRVGELISAHVIPRPDDEVDKIIFEEEVKNNSPAEKKNVIKEVKPKTIVKRKVASVKIENKKVVNKEKISKKEVETVKKIEPKIELLSKKVPAMDELVVLNVHALRRIARGFDNFPIKGRDISKANRAKLLDYFKELQ